MIEPFHTSDKKYSRSQKVKHCEYCNDTSFELLETKIETNRCCRCGKEYSVVPPKEEEKRKSKKKKWKFSK